MPKLLMVATVAPTLRGFLLPFADYFRSQGWQVDGLAQGAADCPICQSHFNQVWDINWSRNPLDFKNFSAAPQWIRRIVLENQYDIVHVHTPVAAFVSRFALRSLRRSQSVSLVYTAHGFHFYQGGSTLKNRIFSTLERIAAPWTDYLIVINQEDEATAKQYQLLPDERLVYCPGIGVDLSYYNPDRVATDDILQVRHHLGVPNTSPLFLVIAEFIPRKRHRDILLAFAQLDPQLQAHLALAGDGPLQSEMQSLATELGILDHVHFLGIRRDIPTLLRASTALLLTSQQEGLPRSVMEALALGVPVIGTQIRGTQELLAEGGGILVPVGDIEAIRQAMAHMVQDPIHRQEMGKQGRASISPFDLKTVLTLHEQLYNRILGQPSPQPKPSA